MSSHIVPVTGTIQTVISSIINNRTSVTVEQQLADHLDRIPITERLGEVQNLLLAISEADASIAEIASKVWMYVLAHRLWESKYQSLEDFKLSIAYGDTILHLLKRYGENNTREQGFARSILANWKSLPEKALPVELQPPKYSRDILQFLSRLSKICPLDKAIYLLKEQIQKRSLLAGPGGFWKMTTIHIVAMDVSNVLQDLQGSGDNQIEGRASGNIAPEGRLEVGQEGSLEKSRSRSRSRYV